MYAMSYTLLINLSSVSYLFISLLTNFRDRKLTFREWVPYDYSPFMIFCLTYSYQYLSMIAASLVNIGCDSLIVGLLLHLCCQITILKYRLKRLENDQSILRDCVRHHYRIIVLVATETYCLILKYLLIY